MTAVVPGAATELADAIVNLDFERARGLLDPEIDFRGMTPNRVWEADGPDEVEMAMRKWLQNPEREVESVEVTSSEVVEDTARVGWRVRGQRTEGPFSFEQQAYVRENEGRIVWLRVMCTGPRPA